MKLGQFTLPFWEETSHMPNLQTLAIVSVLVCIYFPQKQDCSVSRYKTGIVRVLGTEVSLEIRPDKLCVRIATCRTVQ